MDRPSRFKVDKLFHIETIKVHDFGPCRDEVIHKCLT